MNNTNQTPEFISQYFEKGNKKKIRCIVYTVGMVLGWLILITMGYETPVGITFISLVLSFVAMFSWIFYAKYSISKKNYNWFLKYGNNEMLSSEINDTMIHEPKCMIVMGQEAIADRYNGLVLIPYSQFAWTYIEDGQVPSTNVYTKDGRQFVLIGLNKDMFADLVNNHVIPASPDVIIGFGKEQQKKYKEIIK